MQVEVDYMLGAVAASECDFYRNGSWYDAKKAVEHLRLKYQALLARNLIHSADDFIDKGATRSSMSGLPYGIRCPGMAEVPAAQWLRELLAQYRRSREPPASSLP